MRYSLSYTRSSAVHLILANGIEKFFGFLIIPLLTNSLSKSDYGELILTYSYASLISMLVYSGLQSAFYRWYSLWDNESDKDIYEVAVVLLVGLFAVLALSFIALFLFLFKINPFGANEKLLVLVLIANFSLIPYSIRLSTWILSGKAHFNILFSFLKGFMVYGVILLIIDHYNSVYIRPYAEILVFILVSMPILISLIQKLSNTTRQQLTGLFPVLKDSLSFGRQSLVLQIGFLFMAITDRIVVERILQSEALAIYAIGMVAMILVAGIDAFISAYGARANSLYLNHSNTYMIQREQIIVIFAAWVGFNFLKVVLIFFSKEIILTLSNESYLDALKLVSLPADILFFQFLFQFICRYFYAKNELKTLIIPVIFGGIINIILSVFLVKNYGMIGAIVSTALVLFILSIYSEFTVVMRTAKSKVVLFFSFGLGLLQMIGNWFFVLEHNQFKIINIVSI